MLTRILTAIVAIAVFLPVLYFSHTPVFAAVLALLSLIAVLEMLRCVGLWRRFALTVPVCLTAAVLPLLPYWLARADMERAMVLAALALMIYAFAVMTFSKGKIKLEDASVALTATVYVIACFTALSVLRYGVNEGKYVYLICFIGAWVTDTFAYFTGFLFGKHKLIPDVSPKKTVEGAVGGVVFCTIAFVGFGILYNKFWVAEGAAILPLWLMAVIGVLVSIVSQIGDLSLSLLKRKYGIKDFGKIFPGHGGVMDRFDSVLAVAIMLLVCFTTKSVFGL